MSEQSYLRVRADIDKKYGDDRDATNGVFDEVTRAGLLSPTLNRVEGSIRGLIQSAGILPAIEAVEGICSVQLVDEADGNV